MYIYIYIYIYKQSKGSWRNSRQHISIANMVGRLERKKKQSSIHKQ